MYSGIKKQSIIAIVFILCVACAAFALSASRAHAQSTDVQARIQGLMQQIEELQAKLQELRQAQAAIGTEVRALARELRLSRAVGLGDQGEDVAGLQEFLSQFKDIYPEGLITGHFGRLTERAVQRFQEKYGIVASGDANTTGFGFVGPRTRARLMSLFGQETTSDVLPPGLQKRMMIDRMPDHATGTPPIWSTDNSGPGKALGNQKVKICHKGTTMEVPLPALIGHLQHGDNAMACPNGEKSGRGKVDDDDKDDNEDENEDEEEDEDDDDTATTTQE